MNKNEDKITTETPVCPLIESYKKPMAGNSNY